MVLGAESDSMAVKDDEAEILKEEGKLGLEGFSNEEVDSDSTFHPLAPPDEVFDVWTTIDPCYIISSIRKIIPRDSSTDDGVNRTNHSLIGEDLDQRETETNINEVWEEFGCVLWDLSANSEHAEFMVQNFIIDVLLANLVVAQSLRVKEICLGIIGNLACHEVPMKQLSSNNTLQQVIVEQLFLDDTRCLSETFRILSFTLQSSDSNPWIVALSSEQTLFRISWIMENTLNAMLLEKSVELLLVILENKHKLFDLLTILKKFDLSKILIDLLSSEVTHLSTQRLPERFSVLDVILRTVEALSITENFSEEVSSNRKLIELLVEIIKLPDKIEVANPCVTAVVLFSNILSDVCDVAANLSTNVTFIEGVVDIFPLASTDCEARSAIWCVLARLLREVKEDDLVRESLRDYVMLLCDKVELIEDDLLNEEEGISIGNVTRQARISALRKIESLVNRWVVLENHVGGDDEDHANIANLLNCCCKYTS